MMKPMQSLIKKLLRFYLFAIVLVLIYFINRTLFIEEKPIELKSFHTDRELKQPSLRQTQNNEKSIEAKSNEEKNNKEFILLPKK